MTESCLIQAIRGWVDFESIVKNIPDDTKITVIGSNYNVYCDGNSLLLGETAPEGYVLIE